MRVERRAHQRIPLEVPCLLDAGVSHHTARCRDVSVGGVALVTDASLAVGTKVEIYFELPNRAAVEAHALVVRTTERELALAFLDLGTENRVALRAFCRSASGALKSHDRTN
jgi:hypothetical protein